MKSSKSVWLSDEIFKKEKSDFPTAKEVKLDFSVGSGRTQKFTTRSNYATIEQQVVAQVANPCLSDQDVAAKNKANFFQTAMDKIVKHKEKVAKYDTPEFSKEALAKLGLEEPEVELDEDSARFLQRRGSEMLVWYPRKASGGGYDDNSVVTSDPISHFNIKDLLARFFIQTHASYGVVSNWRPQVIGVTSLYLELGVGGWGEPVHLPMFDYDGKNIKTLIRKDVKLLQKNYDLGDAWVYETRRGFHVYFFCDRVGNQAFFSMLEAVHCCPGFRRAATHRGSAILRVSAKYTDFDIKLLYILPTSDRAKIRRPGRKAHTIQALLALGEECGTHFASMFPQWAHYQEDQKEWKPAPRPKAGKRIRKVSMKDYESMKHEAKIKEMHKLYNSKQEDPATAGSTAAATVTFTTDTWITVGNSGGTSTSGF